MLAEFSSCCGSAGKSTRGVKPARLLRALTVSSECLVLNKRSNSESRLSLRLMVEFQWFLTELSDRPSRCCAMSDQRLPYLA